MLQTVRSIILNLRVSLLDFVYPPLCVCCGELLDNGKEQVCPRCWDSLARVSCDLPLYNETRTKLLSAGVVDELISVYVFEKEGAFQKIVHSLKYSGSQSLGVELGRRLGARLREQGIRADALVPIPLHKRKLRERGYNQSELIARGCSAVSFIPLRTDFVFRGKFTQTQTTLSLLERKSNMDDAFECTSNRTKGKTIILVDDIITTGATIESCARVLKNAGAGKIIAASVALAE